MKCRRTSIVILLLSSLLVALGCQKEEVAVDTNDPMQTNMAVVASMYAQFKYFKNGQAPKSQEELVSFINESGQSALQLRGIEDASEIFTSERDGQPIKLYLQKPGKTPEGELVIAHEAEGKDGKRAIGLAGGVAEFVDDAQFKKIRF